jgi:hypothetical protein
MKIFINNKNISAKKGQLKLVPNMIGKVKLLPSYSQEWMNTAYFYNKISLKDISSNNLNIYKIIQSYFDLYLREFIDLSDLSHRRKIKLLARKRRTLSKIIISKPIIKYTNNKAKITLFMVNREKSIFKNKYFSMSQKIIAQFTNKYYKFYYKNSLLKLFNIINKFKFKYWLLTSLTRKNKFTKYKLEYLNRFIQLKNLYMKNRINYIVLQLLKKNLNILRKIELKYSLNQYKLNQLTLLPKLSNFLKNILQKKVEYNIINLKSVTHNADIFTNILGILIRRKRKSSNVMGSIDYISNKVHLPKVNSIQERAINNSNIDKILMKYYDTNLISNVRELNSLDSTIINFNEFNNSTENIHNTVFNSINYKNTAGLRIEVGGRLTKRYRADRAIYRYRSKGGLRNLYSSYQGLSSTLFRGNSKSNNTYSFFKSKRRIGSFAVKGWISGK